MEAAVCSGGGGGGSADLSAWPDAVHAGTNQMLRSRLPGPQRHSVLQLAAAMVELAGAGWLLPRKGAEGRQDPGSAPPPGALLAVMVETLSVSGGNLFGWRWNT